MMMVDEPVVETAPPPHTLSPPKTTGLPSNSFSPSHTHLSSSPPSAFPFVDPELLQVSDMTCHVNTWTYLMTYLCSGYFSIYECFHL